MKCLIILFYLLSSILLSKNYTLKWYNFITVLDSFEYKDKSIYRLVRADGSWEDNEGLYGSLKCLGPNKISANNEVELNVYCDAYDNEGDTFGLILYRSSDMSAGIGTATYIKTSGKYKKFEDWKNMFYLPVSQKTFNSLSDKGIMMINILDPKVNGIRYKSGEHLVDILKDNFIGQLGMRIMQRPQGASVFKDDKGNFDRNKLNKYMQKIYIENIWCFAKDKKTGVFDFLKEGTLEKFLYDI